MNQLPAEDLPVPPASELRTLPYDKGVMLHLASKTRWYKTDDGLIRDLTGERDWHSMGKYVNRTYDQLFLDAWLRTDLPS